LRELGLGLSEIKRNAALVRKIDDKFGVAGTTSDTRIITAVEQGLASSGSGHRWPPIIKLTDADGYFFESGKATLRPEFEAKIRGPVIEQLLADAQKYDTDVIEVVGHTDEQPIGPRSSNLDKELMTALVNHPAVDILLPADNAGLGIARAVSVAGVLKADGRLANYKVLPLSGAQLINPDETLVTTLSLRDVRERRRIEIRLRKSTPAVIPMSSGPPLPLTQRDPAADRGTVSSIPKGPNSHVPPKPASKPRPQAASVNTPRSVVEPTPTERRRHLVPPR